MRSKDLFKRFWYCPVGQCVPENPCTSECGYMYQAILTPDQYAKMRDVEL